MSDKRDKHHVEKVDPLEEVPSADTAVLEVASEEGIEYGKPAQAPDDSYWARQEGVDFFLPPAISLDRLVYLSLDDRTPEQALRTHFGLPREPSI